MMPTNSSALIDGLSGKATDLQNWLERDALPLWWSAGTDRDRGGFEELLDLNGARAPSPRRFRVQPRQVYCYIAAGSRGWFEPWAAAADHGVDYFESRYMLESGYFATLADEDGQITNPEFDLYNQAFALFAYAQMAVAFPDRAADCESKALKLIEVINQNYRHPKAGFEEGFPRKLPLCSNPHMHLLEATLAWEAASPSGDPLWAKLTDEIVNLCLEHFIDPVSGGLREFFDADWAPYPDPRGQIMEPGHQFEWAWLLVRWGRARNADFAFEKAKRLFEIGASHGICDWRHAAMMQLSDDFSVKDGSCRLWPQTEWLKAAMAMSLVCDEAERPFYLAHALKAIDALERFLNEVPTRGLWRDRLTESGEWRDEAAPASTFYHIVCAILELHDALMHLRARETTANEYPN